MRLVLFIVSVATDSVPGPALGVIHEVENTGCLEKSLNSKKQLGQFYTAAPPNFSRNKHRAATCGISYPVG